MPIKYLHTMVRVKDLDASIAFYKLLGLVEPVSYTHLTLPTSDLV